MKERRMYLSHKILFIYPEFSLFFKLFSCQILDLFKFLGTLKSSK